MSRAKYVIVVTPSAEIGTRAWLPITSPSPVCAPLSVKWICLTPDPPSLSVAVSLTVTAVVFQPRGPGSGVTVALVAGAVRSILTIANAVVDPPAELIAVHVRTVPWVSSVSVTGSHPTVLTRGTALLTAQVTVTGVRFQPAAFGSGLRVGTTCGGAGG